MAMVHHLCKRKKKNKLRNSSTMYDGTSNYQLRRLFPRLYLILFHDSGFWSLTTTAAKLVSVYNT